MISTVFEQEFLADQPAGRSFFEAKASGLIQVLSLEPVLNSPAVEYFYSLLIINLCHCVLFFQRL